MKKVYFLIISLLISALPVLQAQDANAHLDEAKKAYNSGNLDDARFALQQALEEIDKAIGQQILGILPKEVDDLKAKSEDDSYTGNTMGYAGVFVNRSYSHETASLTVQVITDSPLLSGVNTLLALPVFMSSDPNQKRIKVDGYKALLQKYEDDEGNTSYSIQIPFGSSLMILEFDGIAEEGKVTAIANQIPIGKVVNATK